MQNVAVEFWYDQKFDKKVVRPLRRSRVVSGAVLMRSIVRDEAPLCAVLPGAYGVGCDSRTEAPWGGRKTDIEPSTELRVFEGHLYRPLVGLFLDNAIDRSFEGMERIVQIGGRSLRIFFEDGRNVWADPGSFSGGPVSLELWRSLLKSDASAVVVKTAIEDRLAPGVAGHAVVEYLAAWSDFKVKNPVAEDPDLADIMANRFLVIDGHIWVRTEKPVFFKDKKGVFGFCSPRHFCHVNKIAAAAGTQGEIQDFPWIIERGPAFDFLAYDVRDILTIAFSSTDGFDQGRYAWIGSLLNSSAPHLIYDYVDVRDAYYDDSISNEEILVRLERFAASYPAAEFEAKVDKFKSTKKAKGVFDPFAGVEDEHYRRTKVLWFMDAALNFLAETNPKSYMVRL